MRLAFQLPVCVHQYGIFLSKRAASEDAYLEDREELLSIEIPFIDMRADLHSSKAEVLNTPP